MVRKVASGWRVRTSGGFITPACVFFRTIMDYLIASLMCDGGPSYVQGEKVSGIFLFNYLFITDVRRPTYPSKNSYVTISVDNFTQRLLS